MGVVNLGTLLYDCYRRRCLCCYKPTNTTVTIIPPLDEDDRPIERREPEHAAPPMNLSLGVALIIDRGTDFLYDTGEFFPIPSFDEVDDMLLQKHPITNVEHDGKKEEQDGYSTPDSTSVNDMVSFISAADEFTMELLENGYVDHSFLTAADEFVMESLTNQNIEDISFLTPDNSISDNCPTFSPSMVEGEGEDILSRVSQHNALLQQQQKEKPLDTKPATLDSAKTFLGTRQVQIDPLPGVKPSVRTREGNFLSPIPRAEEDLMVDQFIQSHQWDDLSRFLGEDSDNDDHSRVTLSDEELGSL